MSNSENFGNPRFLVTFTWFFNSSRMKADCDCQVKATRIAPLPSALKGCGTQSNSRLHQLYSLFIAHYRLSLSKSSHFRWFLRIWVCQISGWKCELGDGFWYWFSPMKCCYWFPSSNSNYSFEFVFCQISMKVGVGGGIWVLIFTIDFHQSNSNLWVKQRPPQSV